MKFFEEIFIGSKFDAKGFKQAETALNKLAGTTKKLAGAAGIAYGASAITAYGKAAVKAFADDEAAALRLSRAVENLGIGFANPAIAEYIANLEKSAAVADDILRPAFQSLLTTTGSLTKSQELLNNAITISRASGVDLATVTEDLGKGYIGITKGLTKYNTGLTRAELQSKSFNEILGVILKRSAGAAEDYLDTTAYKFDVLSIATSNASEIIGGGLVDALALVGGGTEATDAAYVIEGIATALSKVTVQAGRTIGVIPTLINNLKNLPKNIFQGFAGAQLGINVIPPTAKAEEKATLTEKRQQELLAQMEKDSLKREKERLALLNKQNAAKKLQGLIDKANMLLNKGEGIFDLEKIQIAAALTNQAEILGRATTDTQKLQIANDTARLNVKQSMLDLEDAIASKDSEAIIKATAKLNEDLKILNVLQGQKNTLTTIDSILEDLEPEELIDQKNLDDALKKIKELLALLAQYELMSKLKIPTSASLGTGIPVGDYIEPISKALGLAASTDALLEYSDAATARADAFSMLTDQKNYADYLGLIDYQRTVGDLGGYSPTMNSGGSRTPVVNVYANTIANPDELTNMIQNAIITINSRGDALVQAGSL